MLVRINPSSEDFEQLQQLSVDPAVLQDDYCDYSDVLIRKPWGWEYLVFQNESVAVWALHIKQGHQTSVHCHPEKKTALVVLSGEAECSTLRDSHRLAPGQGLFIDRGVFHSTRAVTDIMVMEIEQGTNKKNLVRLHDQYGRESKGYEGSAFHETPDPLAHPSFHQEQERYDTPRFLGECEVAITRIEGPASVDQVATAIEADIVAFLRGRLHDQSGERVIAQAGDSFSRAEFQNFSGSSILEPVELLLIRRKNR